MYYPTGEISDYIFGSISLAFLIVLFIYLWKVKKPSSVLKYTDKEYLKTLGITELRYLLLSADDPSLIEEIIEERRRQT